MANICDWRLLGRPRGLVLMAVGGLVAILVLSNLWAVNEDLFPSSFQSPSASPAAFVPSNEIEISQKNHTVIPIDDESPFLLPPPTPSADGITRNHSIIYVHVGKTGGSTLDKALRSNCLWYDLGSRRRKCLTALAGGGSESLSSSSIVSELTQATLHFGPKRDFNQWIQNATMFMVTLRNPIARAVSSFNFDHPSNNDPRRYQKGGMPDSLEHFYVECFATIQEMADLLQLVDDEMDSLTKKQHICYDAAIRTLAGNGSKLAASHLRMNYAFYSQWTMALYPDRPLLVVRTEYIWEDLARIDRMLGGNGYFSHAGMAYTHGSESHAVRQGLSDHGKQTVCCYLADEMQLYENLLRKAVNLFPVEIGETLSDVHRDCGLGRVELLSVEPENGSFDWKKWASEKCPLSTLL